ncbi:uncharacterized protein LOC131232360 [Magnolia sinica]|uniref:uncharacterized protein LOC131232360 n=1 Tax=Magnolia sinica TaxID=86752 RepID=UPI0026587271|nr:uncharacterized protein LOC131232360 [Magnolia sinica]
MVKWFKPLTGWVKLNANESSTSNPSLVGGEGIYRGDKGDFIFGYYIGYGMAFNTRAEIRAIYDGLHICFTKGLYNVVIESDSQLVINFLSGTSVSGWKWKYYLDRIKHICINGQVKFDHILREGNGSVDGMARLGSGSQNSAQIVVMANLPSMVKGSSTR